MHPREGVCVRCAMCVRSARCVRCAMFQGSFTFRAPVGGHEVPDLQEAVNLRIVDPLNVGCHEVESHHGLNWGEDSDAKFYVTSNFGESA